MERMERMEPLVTPSRAPLRVRSEEPFSTPVKSLEPRYEVSPSTYCGSFFVNGKVDVPWLKGLEQQLLERLRKDAYLMSTLKRSMRKDMEEQLLLARRELEVVFARELRGMRESTAVEVQAMASEVKSLRHGGSDNMAEAVAKLCVELEHVTKESVSQHSFQASMRELRGEAEETFKKCQQQHHSLEDLQDQVRELKTKLQENWDLARRQQECCEDCAHKVSVLKEEAEMHHLGLERVQQRQAELQRGLERQLSGKLESVRHDLDAELNEKLSRGPELKLQSCRGDLAALLEDFTELKRQVKHTSMELCKKRDAKEELWETALASRLSYMEEQAPQLASLKPQLAELREQLAQVSSNWQNQLEACAAVPCLVQEVAQLRGSVAQLRRSPSPPPRQLEDAALRQIERQVERHVETLATRQERSTEQMAILEEKLVNVWGLLPRLSELEHQQKDFWRLEEQLQGLSSKLDRLAQPESLALELSEQRQATCERRVEQLRGELGECSSSLTSLRDEMRKMVGQQSDQLLKMTSDNFSGFLDRLATLERQLHERAPESSHKLRQLSEGASLLERRLGVVERQLETAGSRSEQVRLEHVADGLRRPLELRIQHLEQQIKVEEPSPEPRLAALERRLREAQEENARLARTFEERQSQLEGAVARVSGALPRMSVEIMSDWEALARERFAEAKVSQDLARLSQRLEAAPSASATERCLEELAVLRGRFNALPEVATVQQLQRCYEELTPLKLRMAELPEEVADAKVLELCSRKLGSLEEDVKSVCWTLDGSEQKLKDLTKQFSSVSAMQSQMASMDGQMEIVTGLIQRTDTMVRFLQHIQNGMTDA